MADFFLTSLGSFFIPLILIVFLYFKIFTTQQKVASRRKQIKTNTGSQGGKQVEYTTHQTSSLGVKCMSGGGLLFHLPSDNPCFVCIIDRY